MNTTERSSFFFPAALLKPAALFLTLAACFLTLPASIRAQEEEAAESGIIIDPPEGEISQHGSISVSFPTPMVADEALNAPGQTNPVVFEPPLKGAFEWRSPTEASLILNEAVVPGQTYKGKLVAGLKDLDGNPVNEPNWSVTYETAAFTVSTSATPSEQLRTKPSVYLEFNYPVKYEELAKNAFFQDRDSRARIEAEVTVQDDSLEPSLRGREASVLPKTELPVGRTFDLVLDGVPEADSGKPLSRIYVFPLGTTAPLKTEWIGAFNHVLGEPQIIAKFSDIINPDTVTPESVTVAPAIPNVKIVAEADDIVITGDIEPKTTYRVTVSTAVKGVRGFGLVEPSKWKATARLKSHGIVFPDREITERTALGLDFSFLAANVPEVSWRLGKIPLEKLPYVKSRLFEWTGEKYDPLRGTGVIDPKTGFVASTPTEQLIDSLKLQVAASGTTPGAGEDEEVERKITWKGADNSALVGPYLLEVSTKLPDGRIVGNRTIVSFSDLIMTLKRTSTVSIMRITKMADGAPAAQVPVHAIAADGARMAEARTDANGIAEFSVSDLTETNRSVSHYVAFTPQGPALQFANPERAVGYASDQKPAKMSFVSKIVTDRNLYRPGHTVKFKGFARVRDPLGNLSIPAGKKITWTVVRGYSTEVARGFAVVSADGGWEAEWTAPTSKSIGEYQVRDALEGFTDQRYGGANFQVEEFRVPLFSVSVTPEPNVETAVVGDKAKFIIQSNYFHGAPNALATVEWESTWSLADPYIGEMRTDDSYSQDAKQPQDEVTVSGKLELDAQGRAVLEIPSPFNDGLPRGRVAVSVDANVTSVDGQTITSGSWQTLQFSKVLLGINATEVLTPERGVGVNLKVFDEVDKPVNGAPLEVEVFQVNTKTIKEQVAPSVFQYRNTSEYVSVDKRSVTAPSDFVCPVKGTGRFVVVGRIGNDPQVRSASAETFISGEEPAQVPVEDEVKFTLEKDKNDYIVGEKAILWLQAPFAGKAWITVETDEVIESYYHTMKGNSDRFELPLKEEFAPNVTVTAYIVKPGGKDALPLERVANTSLTVNRPDLSLDVQPATTLTSVRPGEQVAGQVLVTAAGKPVANADLLVYAVDDAILQLGEWSLPNFMGEFYPYRSWSVATFFALKNFVTGVASASLYQKGFILGDKGNFDEKPGRKDFKPLAYWNANLKTDNSGMAKFQFQAPDNLTRFRIVSVAQTKRSQFGVGDSEVEITKPLMAEPALPRFLRQQDEVELRVVVRQNYADKDEVMVRCTAGSGLQLIGNGRETVSTQKDIPSVARFRAKVSADAKEVQIRFDAISKDRPEEVDAVEKTLPILEPEVARQEAIAGNLAAGDPLALASSMPKPWQTGLGTMNISMSTSKFLPALQGIPRILEYPHGCLEQISSRVLAYTTMGNLLAYLPESAIQDNNYKGAVAAGLKKYEESLTQNNLLPYWPAESGAPNSFVTAMAAWAALEAREAGFEVSDDLLTRLATGLHSIVIGVQSGGDSREFALYALSNFDGYSTDEQVIEAAKTMYLQRDKSTDEARAFLALGLTKLSILPEEAKQLLGEIGANKPVKAEQFNPRTFSSPAREEAIKWLAMIEAGGPQFEARKSEIRDGLLKLMAGSNALSTQENLWLLIAFRATLKAEKVIPIDDVAIGGRRGEISRNGASAMWNDLDLAKWQDFSLKAAKEATTYVLNAQYHTGKLITERVDHGFRVERMVKNLTDPARTGETGAAYKLGDQLLITYRLLSKNHQYYVALEDLLPAGLETVNFNLPQIAKFYTIPEEAGVGQLFLSHAELGDSSVKLYFDDFPAGTGSYSILARATAEGKFTWPATQVTPMYDARFSGLGPSSACAVGQ